MMVPPQLLIAMNSKSMKSEIIEYINNQLLNNRTTVDADRELLVSGILDSLAVMSLVAFLEKLDGRKIPPLDVTLENFNSVNAITRYLESRQDDPAQ